MKDIELFDITVEEFDNMSEKHVFSKEYEDNKESIIKEYKNSIRLSKRTKYAKVAAIATVIIVSSPFIANAATNGDLFSRIWGTNGRESIAEHTEVVEYDENGEAVTAIFPKREYVDMEEEKSDELIGENVSFPNITEEFDDTTITILSAVSDENSAVVEFTLEKADGVDALVYDRLSNELKGATFSEKSFWFKIGDGGENIYVDINRSTEDKLYCYDYIALNNSTDTLNMRLVKYSTQEEKNIHIPVQKSIISTRMTNSDNGDIKISPISMKIDMEKGLGLSGDKAGDPSNIYYVVVKYKDGSKYTVLENPKDGIHECEVEIDNTSYSVGGEEHKLTLLFNRLVDINEIDSVTVNDIEYIFE